MKKLTLLIFLFLPFISAFDNELYIPCGGDDQLSIGCIGGDSFSVSTPFVLPTNSYPGPNYNPTPENETSILEPEITAKCNFNSLAGIGICMSDIGNKVWPGSYKTGLMILALLIGIIIILILIIIIKRRRRDAKKGHA